MNKVANEIVVEAKREAERLRRLQAESSGRIAELERQLQHLEGVIAVLERENLLNRQRVTDMRNSLSWRLTSGLRRSRRLASRVMSAERK